MHGLKQYQFPRKRKKYSQVSTTWTHSSLKTGDGEAEKGAEIK
jgi:hypothetical protein